MPDTTLDTDQIQNTPVSRLAAEFPSSTRVFARYDLDFCCGGGRPLREACLRKGLDAQLVADEVRSEIEDEEEAEVNWLEAPLSDLTRHIVRSYHDPLAEELPRLEGLLRKVVTTHGDRDPVRLPALLEVFVELKTELQEHMAKEEKVLFPLIERGLGASTAAPIAVMEDEHLRAGDALRRIRELTDNFTPRANA